MFQISATENLFVTAFPFEIIKFGAVLDFNVTIDLVASQVFFWKKKIEIVLFTFDFSCYMCYSFILFILNVTEFWSFLHLFCYLKGRIVFITIKFEKPITFSNQGLNIHGLVLSAISFLQSFWCYACSSNKVLTFAKNNSKTKLADKLFWDRHSLPIRSF